MNKQHSSSNKLDHSITRRKFLGTPPLSSAAIKPIFLILAIAALILTVRADRQEAVPTRQADRQAGVPTRLNEATVAQLQAEMASGRLTSVELTNYYLARIRALDQGAEGVNSIIELNPDALEDGSSTQTNCAATAQCWGLCMESRCCSKIISTPAIGCRQAPDRLRLLASPLYRTPPSLTICAQAVQSSSVKRISRSGQTFAPLNRSAAGPVAVVRPIIPTA